MSTESSGQSEDSVSCSITQQSEPNHQTDSLQYKVVNLSSQGAYNSCEFPPLLYDLGQTSSCKVLICITIYNEESFELQETLQAVCANSEMMLSSGLVKSSESIGVVLIQDGTEKLSESMKTFGETMNIFRWDQMQEASPDSLHTFATQFTCPKNPEQNYPALTLVSGIKEANKGKLNSHRWFFKVVCPHVNPVYTVLIDCGTIPKENAVYYLVKEMEHRENIGGTCGEIRVGDPKYCRFVEAAQDIEYRVSHFMDKSMESFFGFVSVLPGAFCAFRWESIQGEPLDDHYFYSNKPEADMNCFKANMFLAEDRVLGIALLLRPRKKVLLSYVHKAKAYTDVPTNLVSIIAQRRRWINGSWFALLHTFAEFPKIKDTNHNCFRKFMLVLLMLYNFVNSLVAFLAPGMFYVFFQLILNLSLEESWQEHIGVVLKSLYAGTVFLVFLSSLGSKPTSNPKFYLVTAVILGVFTLLAFGLSVYEMLLGEVTAYVVFFVLGMMICLIGTSLIHGEVLALLRGLFQYMFLLPTYIHVFLIYAFCNVHDVTWGLRNDKESHNVDGDKTEEFKVFRVKFVAFWALLNFVFVLFFSLYDPEGEIYIVSVTLLASFVILFKTLGSVAYKIHSFFKY